jgi:hypothetical protein
MSGGQETATTGRRSRSSPSSRSFYSLLELTPVTELHGLLKLAPVVELPWPPPSWLMRALYFGH